SSDLIIEKRNVIFGAGGSELKNRPDPIEENFFLPAADIYFCTVAHNNNPSFAPPVFPCMVQIDQKGLVNAQKTVLAQQQLIICQWARDTYLFAARKIKIGVGPFGFAINNI